LSFSRGKKKESPLDLLISCDPWEAASIDPEPAIRPLMPLVVFDLDGTLIDSRRDLADAANALIAEHGGVPRSVDEISAMVGEGAPLLVARALKSAGIERDLGQALARFLALYDERLLVHTHLYDGTRTALDEIATLASLAVLTNKPQRPTERILDGLGIAGMFTTVIGGDSPFPRKPDPAALRHVMRAAGSGPDDTIMVGDSAIDLRTARAASIRACLVRYGFGFRSAESELRGDELIAGSPADLVAIVRRAITSGTSH
jgi:phosphoglycolate phosphatase